jgi:tetratricopeptide (TPR) repeat protein
MRRSRHRPPSPPAPVVAPVEAPASSPREWAIVAALVALTAIVFGQLVTHELLAGDVALFRTPSWWQPAHFLINLLLHAASAAVLFVALRKLTGTTGRSAFVAALFAIHPMHVETVARLAERKQLLATLFALLAILAYAHRRLVLVAIAFAASLFFEQTYVALPLLLLLLDWWPLDRLRELRPRLVEKLPLFVLAIAGAVVAIVRGWSAPPLSNALASYAAFLGRFIAPVNLAMPYPRADVAASTAFGAAALLILISFAAIALRRTQPWFATGWFWFVIALAGTQSFADRYSYFSYIGLFIVLAWAGAKLPRKLAMIGATAIVIACAIASFQQAAYWRDSDTLLTHTIEVTPPNAHAEYQLGKFLRGKDDERAMEHLQRALEIASDAMRKDRTHRPEWFGQAYADIGAVFLTRGEKAATSGERTNMVRSAIGASRLALAVDPKIADAHATIARADKMLAADPHSARDTHLNAGAVLSQSGRFTQAVAEFHKAVEIDPNSVEAHVYLALGLLQANRKDDARFELAYAKTLDAGAANEVLTKTLQMPPSPANFDSFVAQIR